VKDIISLLTTQSLTSHFSPSRIMKDIILKPKTISSCLGQVGTGTLSHDLIRWLASGSWQGKPYLKIAIMTAVLRTVIVWELWTLKCVVRFWDYRKKWAGKSTLY
jgi:hypothetical protein